MGWKRSRYEHEESRRIRKTMRISREPKIFLPDGLTKQHGIYIFRPHVFDQYRTRVSEDQRAPNRSDEEIMRIIAHSLDDSFMPEKIPKNQNFNVLTHLHEHNGPKIIDYGIFYTPVKRDRNDLLSKHICVMTLLFAQEKYDRIHMKI